MNSVPVYEGARFSVQKSTANGHEWISPGDVVAILPYDGTSFFLGYQERTPINGVAVGLFAGQIEEGESPLDAARRELKEESGLEPDYFDLVDVVYSSEGITDERCFIYIATGISRYDVSALDRDEDVNTLRVPLYKLPEAIHRVNTSKAKIALLRLWQKVVAKDALRIQLELENAAETCEWVAHPHGLNDGSPDLDWPQ